MQRLDTLLHRTVHRTRGPAFVLSTPPLSRVRRRGDGPRRDVGGGRTTGPWSTLGLEEKVGPGTDGVAVETRPDPSLLIKGSVGFTCGSLPYWRSPELVRGYRYEPSLKKRV